MRTRLAHILSIGASPLAVLVLFAAACDPKPADPGAMETTTSGSDSTDSTDSGTTGEGTAEPEGCVPPSSGDGFPCEVDEDCAIAGDCCGCTAYAPASGSPGNCGGSCEMDKCEEWGISEAACVSGECVAQGLSCNQATVTCDAASPGCDEGFLPQVLDGCFTGDCLPIDACDWVPSCESCADNQACMHETRGGCDYERCVGPIAECQGQGPCACLGPIFCDGMCTPTADGFSCM